MGAGSSSTKLVAVTINNAVLSASQEDISVTLSGLPVADRSRLLRALEAAEAADMNSDLPKLTYFDGAGRAFALRVALFKAFGKDGWVDERISFSEWPALKPTTPLGALPVLTLPGGEVVTQTDAMMRWASRLSGLYPDDPREALVCDAITCTCFEMLNKSPPSSEKEKREEYAAGFLTGACTMLEGKLGNGFILGDSLSLADLMVYTVTLMLLSGDWTHIPASFLDAFPKLRDHNALVQGHELVVAYAANYAS